MQFFLICHSSVKKESKKESKNKKKNKKNKKKKKDCPMNIIFLFSAIFIKSMMTILLFRYNPHWSVEDKSIQKSMDKNYFCRFVL